MSELTLKQVCDLVGVSRRAIQGYENERLVHSTGRTKQGYLLYNEEMIKRIQEIKMYQDAGFHVKQIAGIIDESIEIKKKALKEKIKYLNEKKEHIDITIHLIETYLEKY